MDALIFRIERLERENRYWKLGAMLGIVTISFMFFVGAARNDTADEVRAKRFVAVDQDGTPRATLTGDPGLHFFDKDRRDLVRLVVQVGLGPNLWMMSETAERSRIRLAAQNDGAFMNMNFPVGETGSGLGFFGALANGAGLKFHADGLRSSSAELLLEDSPALRLRDTTGRILWKAP